MGSVPPGLKSTRLPLPKTYSAVVARILTADHERDAGAIATPLPDMAVPKRPGNTASETRRRRYRSDLADQMDELTGWWLRRMVTVEQPTREKLTLLWHNHFATSAKKVQRAALMSAQNEKLRTLCLGDFQDLAYAMLTDAAMIHWLDGQKSKAGAPNENLAREFLELFALGHGNGYTESDVKEGARALTGWKIGADGNAVLSARRHDAGTKTVLGSTGNLDAEQFCRIVVSQPHSPRYIATRLWQQLASDTPPTDQTLGRLVGVYGSERDSPP